MTDVSVRSLRDSDLPEADRIFRLAFGTLLGLPDPMRFGGDAELVRTRYRADPATAFAAELGGELVASNFVTTWGSVGLFGPLTVRPDLWDRGIAKHLLGTTMEILAERGTKHTGLFTNVLTTKNIALYQKLGYWPRFLTAIMSKPVSHTEAVSPWSRYSDVPQQGREACLSACREVTGAVYDGLDVEREIRSVDAQGLGDTVLLWDDDMLDGFGVCHCGRGSEAGSDMCYVKFGAVRPGSQAGRTFDRLLGACEALAARQDLSALVAGVNTARHEAYRQMLARGFRIQIQGVAMQRPNEPGYNRPDVYVIDDWR